MSYPGFTFEELWAILDWLKDPELISLSFRVTSVGMDLSIYPSTNAK
jgi:hypothetical protein